MGNSLAVQWLGFWAFTAGGPGSIPVWGNKFLRAAQCGQKEQKKEHGELALVDSIESWVGNEQMQTFYGVHLSGEARPVSRRLVRQNQILSAHLHIQSR